MIHELRIYTARPGGAPDMAKNSGTVARAIRGDDYGKLEGYWIAEIGQLNQVLHLWSYSDLNERARLRAELSKNARWTQEYLPLVRPALVRQDIRLMNPIIAPRKPGTEGNIYEMRVYRTKPGAAREWCNHIMEAMPIREKYSKPVGLWITEAGQPNEVVHIWSYPDLNARAAARAAATADPGWQAFLKKSGPLLEEMSSTIMLPSAHSPMK
ncbi:MAG: NIPSNAP family protein [Hyphomicrobiaceae bacterium]|nr:NIPSNAP family protein [Hyphomicrobiaceae bacterium]